MHILSRHVVKVKKEFAAVCLGRAIILSFRRVEREDSVILRRRAVFMLTVCILVLYLVSCGASPSITSDPTPAPALESQRTETMLVLWYAWPAAEQRALATLVERYNRSRPTMPILLQPKSLASIAAEFRGAALTGSGPHLILLHSHTIGDLARDGLLLALDDRMPSGDLEKLIPSTLGSAQVRDAEGEQRLYGIPLTFDTLALYYNKANLVLPPSDIDTLLRNARGLTDASTEPPIWGLAYHLSLDKTIAYFYAFGGRIFGESGDLVLATEGSEGAERWLAWLRDLRQDQQILAGTDGIAVDNALMTRQALMTVDWANALPRYHSLWGENMGVAALPGLSAADGAARPYVQSDSICINAQVVDSSQQDAAIAFIRYLLEPEAQQVLLNAGKQPTLLSLDLDGDAVELAAARAFRTQAQQGQPMPNTDVIYEHVWDVLEQMQNSVLRGLAAPEEAVTYADEMLRERLGLPATP